MLNHFPFEKVRPGGKEAISKIEEAFASGKRFVMLEAPTGCHKKGTEVIMYDGTFKKVENVVVGDLLMGPDSTPRKVMRLCRGRDMMYEVTPISGMPFVVNGEHVLSLECANEGEERIDNITVNNYLEKSKCWKHLRNLYRVGVDFRVGNESLSISPYLLGLSSSKDSSVKKVIPHRYKVSSRANRVELLSGLLDADANLNGYEYEYVSKSSDLAEDTAFLARSLGLAANILEKAAGDEIHYMVTISGDTDMLRCRVVQKQAKPRKQKKSVLRTGIRSIKKLQEDDFYGFTLNKDHLYLMRDFTVTHNSGKSGFAVAFARKYNATIWTPTKFLQTQYAETPQFIKEYTIKGKSNYFCELRGQGHVQVDEAICCSSKIVDENRDIVPWPLSNKPTGLSMSRELKSHCIKNAVCDYYTKLANMHRAPGAVINYDLGLRIKPKLNSKHDGLARFGEAIVMDEAHQLISKITSIFGTKVTNVGAVRLFGEEGRRNKGEHPKVWFNRLRAIAQARESIERDTKKISKIKQFAKRMTELLDMDIDDDKKFFVEDGGDEVEVRPLDLRYLKEEVFHPFKKILLLSATFPKNFREVLGISEAESEVVSIESTFDPSNRRAVFPRNLSRMNAKTILSKDSDQIRMMDLILEAYKGEKGIIHTGNYKFMSQLRDIYKRDKRFLWVNQDDCKLEAFEKHAKSPSPTILVSPAMLEGVDLKDDLARFGIMLKVPYSALDDYTKKMTDIFPSWYANLVITNIVQAYGRQVRNENDKAEFFILDGAFNMLLSRDKKLFPKYFIEGLKVGDAGKLVSVLKRKAIKQS